MTTDELTKAGFTTAILELFPRQGEWGEGDYFSLPGNRLVELVRGRLEVLPVPSLLHQFIARLFFLWMNKHVEREQLGMVMLAPTRVRIRDRVYREPDVLFVANRNRHRRQEQFWETIDVAVEIISPDDPDRDLVDKRSDYAQADVAEYWVVDPRDDSICVLQLRDGVYYPVNPDSLKTHAQSLVVPGFCVDTIELFRQARAE